MRGFLINIIIQSFAILGICFILAIAVYSIKGNFYSYYEQEEVIHRAEAFRIIDKEVNTVFIGSSRIFRHVNPPLFDSLVSGSQSYNLGYAGMFPFRSYDYLEYLNLQNNPSIEHVFIELSPIALLGKNYNTDPFIYSTNFNQYLQVINYCFSSGYSTSIKLKYLGGYSLLLLYKYTGIGSSKYITHSVWGASINNKQEDIKEIRYYNGYLSLDEDLNSRGENYPDLKNRKDGFNKNYEQELAIYIDAYNKLDENNLSHKPDDFTKYILDKTQRLIQEGIQVHFIISPRQEFGDLNYVKNQKEILENFQIYDFSNPVLFPSLYNKENSFDRVHLNEKGAQIFTMKLAEQVKEEAIYE